MLREWYATVWYWWDDLKSRFARFLLKTDIGHKVILQWHYQKVIARARELGCAVYCVYHDCAFENCPPECHD